MTSISNSALNQVVSGSYAFLKWYFILKNELNKGVCVEHEDVDEVGLARGWWLCDWVKRRMEVHETVMSMS